MSFFSPNLPAPLGPPNPKVLRHPYKFDAQVYLCIDVDRAEKEGVTFWYGRQGAVMTRKSIPANCFVYWSDHGCQTTNEGEEFTETLTKDPYRPKPVDPATHTKSSSAEAKASAVTKPSPRGSVGPEIAAAKAAAVPGRVVYINDQAIAKSADELLMEYGRDLNKKVNQDN